MSILYHFSMSTKAYLNKQTSIFIKTKKFSNNSYSNKASFVEVALEWTHYFYSLEWGKGNRILSICYLYYQFDAVVDRLTQQISLHCILLVINWQISACRHTFKNNFWETNDHPNQAGSVSWMQTIHPRADSSPVLVVFFFF